ncbi:peptide chain release factor N(5)-glutamine methyltransferase [bacterium]|nr:peptide chain release factor N(5)-glutamine methyltransferase [bacterium]NBW98188.1 peptide chain release factor N(5)-glutamine methyltransferase [bacterium]NBX82165.1 peptide chain release factor N(5)-glutamine methyltransferase [bacterium]
MTLEAFVASGKIQLEKSKLHFSSSQQHMDQLVLRTLGWTATQLFLKKKEELEPEDLHQLQVVLEKRLKGEPLQYILGFEYFYESRFEVGPGCLIPRKETELIVDELLFISLEKKLRIAELGAGSGNIGISVLLKRPHWEWHAFEINPQSSDYAEKNRRALLSEKSAYHLHRGDFFEQSLAEAPYDIVVANPPYISTHEMKELPREVLQEPHVALEAGEEGLQVIQKLLDYLPRLLKPGDLFLCEMGSGQSAMVQSELKARKFESFSILKDLSGLPRVLKLRM